MESEGSKAVKGPKPRLFPVLLKLEWKMSLREPYGLVLGILFPILLLVLFGTIGAETGTKISGLTIIQYYVPTIIVIGFISIAFYSVPITIIRDREIGWLRRVSTTPLSPAKLLLSHLVINLIFSAITIAVILAGSIIVFGASLDFRVFYFSISIIFSLLVLFSLGIVIAAFAPSQRASAALAYPLFMGMMFFAGLWIQPDQVGEPLRSIMWYSPSGAASRTILYSALNATPPYTEFLAMAIYSVVFGFIAIRFFKWT